ncbi:MAG: hypothetical protein KC766_03370 [Myxococcales bacterium]|nr:hypothetical protein [Myxococcales bacterium]
MGILGTRWEGEYRGHAVVVDRNEWTKGFKVLWDGEEIARRTWSLVGLGELRASVELEGQPQEVHVALEWDGVGNLDGSCEVSVAGEPITLKQVK